MEWAGVQPEDNSSSDSGIIIGSEETVEESNCVYEEIVEALRRIIRQGNLKGSKGRFVYMNILKGVEESKDQIKRIEDIRRMKHVGERSYRKIEQLVRKKHSAGKELINTKHSTEEPSKPPSRPKKSECGNSKYIPGFRTAPYAILRAMHELKSAHKHLIALKAAPFTDTEFSATQRFSAFSAFKLLERHGMICNEGRGRYSLTESGGILTRRLFHSEQPVAQVCDNQVFLVVDSREKKSNRERLFFQEYLAKHKVESCTRFLGLGDFLWIRNERILGHIVERKAGSDLIASISDGRFREQKRRLKLFDMRAFLLIEKAVFEEASRGMVEYSLMEARLEGLTVIETESISESGWTIREIDKKVRKDSSEDLMSYGSFIEEGSKNRNCTAGQILLSALLGVRGLKKRWAVRLQEQFGTLGVFLALLGEDNAEETLAKMQLDGTVLGHRIARRITELFK